MDPSENKRNTNVNKNEDAHLKAPTVFIGIVASKNGLQFLELLMRSRTHAVNQELFY